MSIMLENKSLNSHSLHFHTDEKYAQSVSIQYEYEASYKIYIPPPFLTPRYPFYFHLSKSPLVSNIYRICSQIVTNQVTFASGSPETLFALGSSDKTDIIFVGSEAPCLPIFTMERQKKQKKPERACVLLRVS